MRRLAVILGGVMAALWVAAPASAFAHDKVTNPAAHAALDVLVLAVVTAPLWTAYLWGGRRRGLLLALVAVVQLPVAVIAFVPIVHPAVHAVGLTVALGLTIASLVSVRRSASSPAAASEPV
ncbi:hypothetical protein SAMN05444365_105139 [Micromonospora pattaloongensis]|uniref:Low temperature requirement A protein (LtrA) n=1 Tax=Micromonospora pattaloongensis TaxID=405436 RepID=A0A1H3PZU1_9ACTN|nr:hypothetical protein [Micromonospora pattaloongensis]SDZ06657.1 hypothetical protein SAMN05444365_105139 [Micromonospora pattaloongensis]